MFRMFALAVLLMALSTTAAHGRDGDSAAAPGDPGDAGMPGEFDLQAIDLRVPSALAWVQPSVRGTLSGRTAAARGGVLSAPGRATVRGGVAGGLQGPGGKSESAMLAYTLSERLSLDVGYDFLDVEDTVIRRGEPGTVDPGFTSHHLVFHARWRF